MKQFIIVLSRLTLIASLFVFPFPPVVASAEAPWQWEMSLSVKQRGESMYMPSAVAFDEDSDRYYVIDTGRNRLISFERDGKMLRAFTADDRLKAPFDMVRLDNGQLWVVEKGRNSLTFIDIPTKKVEPNLLKDGQRTVFPDRIATHGQKLYLLDRASGEILQLGSNLTIEKRYACKECREGFIDFVIHKDAIFALEPQGKTIYRFSIDGNLEQGIPLGGEAGFPVSFDIDLSGYFYVLDRHANQVLVYDDSGQFRYHFLNPGQMIDQVYFARQLRFDPWGRLCVVDEGNGRVEIFSR